jgi:hypothetical protein
MREMPKPSMLNLVVRREVKIRFFLSTCAAALQLVLITLQNEIEKQQF